MTECAGESRPSYEDLQSAAAISAASFGVGETSEGARYRQRRKTFRRTACCLRWTATFRWGRWWTSRFCCRPMLWAREADVQIDCRGRVVRSFEDRGRRGVGVVIDEYHFERA